MRDIKQNVDKLIKLGFIWNGKDYIKDDIIYNQEKLINETENEFNIQYTLIKDKLKKRE